MLFFKRILKPPPPPAPPPAAPAVPPVERRRTRRYAVNPHHPLKAIISFVGRDDSGAPMSQSRHGWNWKGRLIDCSEQGVRIQMGPTFKVAPHDPCDLLLTIEDFELTIPCQIANIREQADGVRFGLRHTIENPATLAAYGQLLDILALGSTLKLHSRKTQPDRTGYLVEHYTSDRPARLTVWRHPDDRSVGAFQFLLKDSVVRANAGQAMEFLTGPDGHPADRTQAREIHRLYRWVVPNLSAAVPDDVRKFLLRHAV